MKTMKKIAAFKKMTETFGPWKTWSRADHLAYGLVRGIEHSRMEKCSNDNPPTYEVARKLWDLGAYEEHAAPPKDGKYRQVPREIVDEVCSLITWVKKEPRVKKVTDDEAAE